MTAFIVEFIFRKYGTEEDEMEDEHSTYILHSVDDTWFSEEMQKYMPLYRMAQESLEECSLGYWKVIMTGHISFIKDYYGEVDADYHIDSSDIYMIGDLDKQVDSEFDLLLI